MVTCMKGVVIQMVTISLTYLTVMSLHQLTQPFRVVVKALLVVPFLLVGLLGGFHHHLLEDGGLQFPASPEGKQNN